MFQHLGLKILLTSWTCLNMAFQGILPNVIANDAPSTDWQVMGQFGGPVQGIATDGENVYAGVGPRLISMDASDPTALHPIGGTTMFDDFVQGVTVSDDLAFIATGSAGLRIVDISDPTNLTEIGAWDSPGYAKGIVVSGQTAYLADGPFGLAIINITNPKQPQLIGSAYSTEFANGVAFSDQHVYVAAGSAGILVVDVTNPEQPIESGIVNTPGFAYGVAAGDNYVYVADGWNGLQVVNVVNPAIPALGSQLATPGWAFGITLSETRTYMADASGGLRIIDVADPSIPREIGSFLTGFSHTGGVAVAGNIAFMADRSGGVRAVDVSIPTRPIQIAQYSPLDNAVRVVVEGHYAYIAGGNSGLRIVDVADITHPIEIGFFDTQGFAGSVQVSGGYAYVAILFSIREDSGCGMYVVDITNPANPTKVAFSPSPYSGGAYRDLEVVEGIAYLVDEISLHLVSVEDPRNPVHLSRIMMMEADGQETVGISVVGNIAYVASSFAGLKTVDVSDPYNPIVLGQSTTEWSFSQDVEVVGDVAYMADYNILRMVDVSDPAYPKSLGHIFSSGETYDVSVEGDIAYLADSGQGLTTVDVSNPTNPVFTGGFNTIGIAHGVTTSDGIVYLADGPNGLVILAPAQNGTAMVEKHNSMAGVPTTYSAPLSFASTFPPVSVSHKINLRVPSRMGAETQLPDTDGYARLSSEATAAPQCTVTSAEDSGEGTLRACLGTGKKGIIDFSPSVFPPEHPVTISLLTSLPDFAGYVTLDASNAGVILDGSNLEEGEHGLSLISDGNIVRGLQLTGFPNSAIKVDGRNNIIGGDRGLGTGPVGQGNLISGNRNIGIDVSRSGTSGNLIVGNLIGTDITGTEAWGNANIGIFLFSGAHDNTVGGTEAWQRNIISDNYYAGIAIMEAAHHNQVIGNYVGTDISGTKAIGNRGNGITMELAGYANLVQGNLSSGNSDVGVGIADQGSDYNIIIGNRVGTDASGTRSIPNEDGGVRAGFGGASFNRFGGTEPGEGNLISGNTIGVSIGGSNSIGNLVLGNLIGTDVSGLKALGNTQEGLIIMANETIVEGNIVAANGRDGISLRSGSTPSFVLDNIIGTDQSGVIQLGNAGTGISIFNSEINFIQGNLVIFNRLDGVRVNESQRITIRRNSIYSNEGAGIVLDGISNDMLTEPVLVIDSAEGVSGTACADCMVELFADAGNEGRYYLDSRVTDAEGIFSFGNPCLPADLRITATSTDRNGNTSPFSVPVFKSWTCSTLNLLSP